MRVLSLAPSMLAHSGRRRRELRAFSALLAAAFIVTTSACDKVPLLPPGGTVITPCPTSTTVAMNSENEVVATAIENGATQAPTPTPPPDPTPGTPTTPTTPTGTSSPGAGTPVQNGTVITFTTTIGRIEPAE